MAVGSALAAILIGDVATPAQADIGLNDGSSVFWNTGDQSTNAQNGMNQASFNDDNVGGIGDFGGIPVFRAFAAPLAGGGGHGKLPKSITGQRPLLQTADGRVALGQVLPRDLR
ncbi:hypothetical protein [Streptomyces variegatus]|uniref:hypothetical protein n=1 Tax=Streptomyces variegatus TaxID=284040 RepID=UPI003C2C1126